MFKVNEYAVLFDMKRIALNPNKRYSISEVFDNRYSCSNVEPIILDSDNVIIDGYKRYLLFIRNGEKKIPIIRDSKTENINIVMPKKIETFCLFKWAA